jgi:hypothetical protein
MSVFKSFGNGHTHDVGGEPDKGLRETINQLLMSHFGRDTVTGQPMWRVSWSEDQFEKRLGEYEDFTDAGIYIRTVKEVREVPKYRQWIVRKYVLEQLVGIPAQNMAELPTARMSYEPMFPFEDRNGDYLPPSFEAAKFVIDSVYAATGKESMSSKYVDNDADGADGQEAKKERVDKLVEELFGDESGLGGAVVHGEGVAGFYPGGKPN